jgi:hypothetical protein
MIKGTISVGPAYEFASTFWQEYHDTSVSSAQVQYTCAGHDSLGP